MSTSGVAPADTLAPLCAALSTDPPTLMTGPRSPAHPRLMDAINGPHPPDPYLTPAEELMLELGWLELWQAVREESPVGGSEGDAPDAYR